MFEKVGRGGWLRLNRRDMGGMIYVQRDVPGMLYQPPGGDGGRGLSAVVSTVMAFAKPSEGFAGMVIEKVCGMRVVRPRRKESVGDIVVDVGRERCRLMQVQKTRREEC